MPTYNYAIEASPHGTWPEPGETDRTGTGWHAGPADEYARATLDAYLADVATDAELPRDAPGAEPCTDLRIIVWNGDQPGGLPQAAAVVYWTRHDDHRLIHDLALVIAGAQRTTLGPAPRIGLRHLTARLGLAEQSTAADIETRLAAALGLPLGPGSPPSGEARFPMGRRIGQPGDPVRVQADPHA